MLFSVRLVIEQEISIFLICLILPKNGFPIPTAENGFHILNLHPKIYVLKKVPLFNAKLLEK